MTRWPLRRVLQEVELGALALVTALVVLGPAFIGVNLLYRAGLYWLLFGTVALGALLMFYQVRLRASLREPAMRAAAGIAEALRTADTPVRARETPSAFRTWGGVPISALRVSVLKPASGGRERSCGALCGLVVARVRESPALTWAFSEVGGERLLLLREPESVGEHLEGVLAYAPSVLDKSFHHLWSEEGPAGYEEPVAFATALMLEAAPGHEAELHARATELGSRVAHLPDVAGVEVLRSEEDGAGPTFLLWLAAGVHRSARRAVYLALEPTSALTQFSVSLERYDLLACETYAGAASTQPHSGMTA